MRLYTQFQAMRRRILSVIVIVPFVLAAVYSGGLLYGLLLLLVSLLALKELWDLTASVRPLGRWLFLFGALYILAAAAYFYHLRAHYDVFATMLFFVAVWSSDIGAYFAGKFIGGKKMSKGISPNKTWAGYGGALIAPAFVLSIGVTSIDALVIVGGIALGVVGQAGDLLASWLKRVAAVKDSGDLIPGHGGILDRVDSLIPAIFVYLALIKLGLFV